MDDARNLLHRLIDTGFGGRSAPAAPEPGVSPGAPMEGPRGGGASSTRFAGLMEWLGTSLMEPGPTDAGAVDDSELDGDDALLLVRAMVAAAGADGRIDPTEEARILRRLEEAGASPGERDMIVRELHAKRPFDAGVAVGDQRRAARIYAASVAAVDADRPAERRYLRDLATRLALPTDTVVEVHRRLGTPVPE